MITEANLVAQPSSSSAGAARERDRQVDTAAATTSVLGPAPAPTSTQGRQTAPKDTAGVSTETTAGSQLQTRIQLPPISQIGDLPRQSTSAAAPTPAAGDPPRPNMTRNLIGALVASAYKLRDTQNELGVWFILSDLSVRTEGTFRLKFSFFNLTADHKNLLEEGSTPVQCTVFSNPFTVFSAKRFPGMIESSDLSRKFAAQGMKLPVRNETRKA